MKKENEVHPHFMLRMDMIALGNFIWHTASKYNKEELQAYKPNNKLALIQHYFKTYVDYDLFNEDLFNAAKFKVTKRDKVVYLFALGFNKHQVRQMSSSSPNTMEKLYNGNWNFRSFVENKEFDRIAEAWQAHRQKYPKELFAMYTFKK